MYYHTLGKLLFMDIRDNKEVRWKLLLVISVISVISNSNLPITATMVNSKKIGT